MKVAILVVGLAVVIAAAATGWVFNLLEVVHSPAISQWAGVHVLRAIGIFVAPLGAIMGYL
jgi:hypothetical protein